MTVYTFDSEFIEDGRTIELISIGIVCEDGREYYAVNANAPWQAIGQDEWLMANVVPALPQDDSDPTVKHPKVIAKEVREFLLDDGPPELWTDYGSYDFVVLCQLWGRMVDLPDGIPMWTRDLQHEAASHHLHIPEQESGQHNALDDARHVMSVLREEWGHVR